mgnify:CR=1 FL=1
MYVEGNPVNAVDPSGFTPLRLGYMEGYSTSAGLLDGHIQGNEIVYDYATMSRARFRYSGIGGLAFVSIGAAIYMGEITGFNYEPKPLPIGLDGSDKLPYSNLIVEDYSGGSTGVYGGISIGLTIGMGYFQSDTGSVKGVFSYASLSAGLPVEVVGFHTTYDVASGIEYYYDPDTGHVNRAKLISDILSGNKSPIPFGVLPSLTSYVGGARTGQISPILLAARRFEKYYYRPQYGQCRDGIPDPPSDLELPYPFDIPSPFPVP